MLAALLVLSGCFGQHNKAVSEGVNLDDERIYGKSRTAPPAQLGVTYPDDETGETAERIQKIRDNFFPQ